MYLDVTCYEDAGELVLARLSSQVKYAFEPFQFVYQPHMEDVVIYLLTSTGIGRIMLFDISSFFNTI